MLDRSLQRVALVAPMALRLSLAVLFLWFGILKIAGDSPVAALVSATVPWGNPILVVRALGAVEVGLGVGLLLGWGRRIVLLAVATHLTGTLLTFVMAPGLMVRHGNPFLLTGNGEFVLKNLVLISAAVLLASQHPGRTAAARRGTDGQNAP
jgi:putative oxidoreductase